MSHFESFDLNPSGSRPSKSTSLMFSKLSNIIFLAAAIATPVLGTTCDSSGSTLSCAAFIPAFCTALPFVAAGGSYGRCYSRIGGRCNFTVKNTGVFGLVPLFGPCVAALNPVAATCSHGGSNQIVPDPFKYTMKPNTGAC
ncbi:hypothetical protein DFH08DRAFT_972967 [Mycena albidolilacea]|uniref:Glycan binding protein Y3-like domain-containing protein n=1 Tax=Mycena albidolilacea TaxID=1033008 RepID=A0AAD7EDE0_9AGAR|nr:hypothetical protein DFH08DRAFT_972967 [Mycena albidolilacea]